MKAIQCAIVAIFLALTTVTKAGTVIFKNLYSFSPASIADPVQASSYGGNRPQGALLLSAGTLFGTTAYGGSNNDGIVFSINEASYIGSGAGNTLITNLHTFTGSDGANPESDLIQSGNTLFGTTSGGGAYGAGTIFALNTDGTGFTRLFNFAFTNGGNPQAGLVLSGSTLYGTTSKGGAYGAGAIFAINTDGTGFTNLYNFDYTNGANPEADLQLFGNTLYGTTENGGSDGVGTIFAINIDGTEFTNLFNFAGTNGANPQAGLAFVGNVLCGTTVNGGIYNAGTAFLIGTNGSGFNLLYNFGSSYTNAANPYSRLVVSSNGPSSYSLYGTSEGGGQPAGSLTGTVFVLNLAGSDLALSSYNVLFSLVFIDQGSPMAGLVLDNNRLFGTTTENNSYFFGGGIFNCSTGPSSAEQVHQFQSLSFYANTNTDGAESEAGLALSGNVLYGTAYSGGTNGYGTIFSIHTDGTGFTPLNQLNSADGAPVASLTIFGNTIYGTGTGSANNEGTIFSLYMDGTGFSNLWSFANSGDSEPLGNLILSGNTLYGTTFFGGTGDGGTLFAMNTDGTDFTNLLNFPPPAFPRGGLILNGNIFYGATEVGGSNDRGSVFAVKTDGTGFTNLFSFSGTNGFDPAGDLVLSGNRLYGVTQSDANRGCGTIFAVNTDGSDFITLHYFSGFDGANPLGGLVLCGNTLYGTTSTAGSGGYGTVFSINTDGACFTNLYNFSGAGDGAAPYGTLVMSGNTLYGTTSSGGSNGDGTIFALSLASIPLKVQNCTSNVVLTWGNPAFSLQSAPSVDGPYLTIPGASSPYTNSVTAAQRFFRLQISE